MAHIEKYDRFTRLPPDAIHELREQLLAAQRSVQDFLEAIPAPAALLTAERQVLLANTRFTSLCEAQGLHPTGLRTGDAIQCQFARELPQGCGTGDRCLSCKALQALLGAIVHDTKSEGEGQFFTLLGEKTLVVSAAPCHLEDGANHPLRYTSIVLQDVTALRTLEKQHETAQQLEAIAMLISGIGHEVNNPLAIAMGNFFLLHRELSNQAELSPRVQTLLSRMDDAHHRIAELVRQFGRFRDQNVSARLGVNLEEHIASHVATLASRPEWEGIRIECEFQSKPPAASVVLPWVQRVLENILCNARDALEDVRNPCVRVRTLSEGDKVLVEIGDNGNGMSEEVLAKAFLPLFSTRLKLDRPGLGLFEARKLMNAMAGDIVIHSQVGQGTQVQLRFAVHQPECDVGHQSSDTDEFIDSTAAFHDPTTSRND